MGSEYATHPRSLQELKCSPPVDELIERANRRDQDAARLLWHLIRTAHEKQLELGPSVIGWLADNARLADEGARVPEVVFGKHRKASRPRTNTGAHFRLAVIYWSRAADAGTTQGVAEALAREFQMMDSPWGPTTRQGVKKVVAPHRAAVINHLLAHEIFNGVGRQSVERVNFLFSYIPQD